MIFRLLPVLVSSIALDIRYSLYHSDDQKIPSAAFDCLYAVWNGDQSHNSVPFIHNYYLIPYCRRPDSVEEDPSIDASNNPITYGQLKQQGVSSETLLVWSSSIDDVERYATSDDNSSDLFYNCSSPWFGSQCQYKFADDASITFSERVRATFASRKDVSLNVTTGTCYVFLDGCTHHPWPFCLDWREICDGKIDCLHGEDEQACHALETNVCADNEYRCHNGQCIPSTFVREDGYSVDCLDGSDERETTSSRTQSSVTTGNYDCISSEIFRCEERMTRYHRHFACGDGQYTNNVFLPARLTHCANNRDRQLAWLMITSFEHIESPDCQRALFCALHANRPAGPPPTDSDLPFVFPNLELEPDEQCESLQEHCTSPWLVIPERPILFGFFQFVYFTNRSVEQFKENVQPDLVCFVAERCRSLLDCVLNVEIINGLICCNASSLTFYQKMNSFSSLVLSFTQLVQQCLLKGNDTSCTDPMEFYCDRSLKCVSDRRVRDGTRDCHEREDEEHFSCSFNDTNRFQCLRQPGRCWSPVAIGNGFNDCINGNDENIFSKRDFNKSKSYSKVCNDWSAQGFVVYNSRDHFDCDWWPCDNPYVHCDGIWDCANGADEINCPNSKCPRDQHECEDKQSGNFYCLPISEFFDRRIDDCYWPEIFKRRLYVSNATNVNHSEYSAWNGSRCLVAEDICRQQPSPSIMDNDVCLLDHKLPPISFAFEILSMETQREVCRLKLDFAATRDELYLTSLDLGNYPAFSSSLPISSIGGIKRILPHIDIWQSWFCHRGILVLHGVNQTKKCLCPPSYFGAQCQWQSQRVSLTLQFVPFRTTNAFQAIIFLIDEHGIISSNYEQIIYVPVRDCARRFNLYLLYPHRPQPTSNNFSIRIDLFDKNTLEYQTSWYLLIPFAFLPVNRITAQLTIPQAQQSQFCPLSCGDHGRCAPYANDRSRSFCRCDHGYSGASCNVTEPCRCSHDAFCLTASICVCPLNKFGRRCHLTRSTNDSCEHQGIGIPTDDRIDLHSLTCLCKEGYTGPRCQFFQNRINLNFDEQLIVSSSLVFIHLVTAFDSVEHERTTTLKRMPIDENRITFYISNLFNMIFVQLTDQSYYLAVVREKFIPAENIDTIIALNQRCVEVNATLLAMKLTERVKFYPLLCRQNPQLMCLYDDVFMCVCDARRFANCFTFNHTIDDNCHGQNHCENNGRCFENNATCPTISICVCRDCYYGSRCQLSAEGYLFSLDSIIGYYIKPDRSFQRQANVVKLSMGIVLVICIVGFIDGFCSALTFQRQKPREVGSGNYLFVSSILSICLMIVLAIKFMHLLLSQMQIITSRTILKLNCHSIDILLKWLLASNQWITACVSIERVISIVQGPYFNKQRSRHVAKRIIPVVLTIVLLSHTHDPLYRQLIEDNDEDEIRISCFVRYSAAVNIYNSIVTLAHLICPLAINVITTIFIVISMTRSRSLFKSKQPVGVHFREQLFRYKHLLYAPCLLIVLGSPRLVISFVSGCMKSPRDPWLYLFGYFVAFIPPALSFLTFVFPSSYYRKEFVDAVQMHLQRFRAIHWFK